MMMDIPKHLCDSCALIEGCPKATRYKEVVDICERHLDVIVEEIKQRPRDDEHEEYLLGVHCAPIVMECPYYRDISQVN